MVMAITGAVELSIVTLSAAERLAAGKAARVVTRDSASVGVATMMRVMTVTLPALMMTSTSSALGKRASTLALKAPLSKDSTSPARTNWLVMTDL